MIMAVSILGEDLLLLTIPYIGVRGSGALTAC